MLKLSNITAAFLLTGCGGFGVDLSDDRTIAIQKSPYLITMNGDITEHDIRAVNGILSFLSTQQFQDDNFTAFSVKINDNTIVTNAKKIDIDTISKDE